MTNAANNTAFFFGLHRSEKDYYVPSQKALGEGINLRIRWEAGKLLIVDTGEILALLDVTAKNGHRGKRCRLGYFFAGVHAKYGAYVSYLPSNSAVKEETPLF